ncbi:MAG: DUF4855 domain-containing protein [Clostridia bacterium]|nr:DUF4855 domain-containing protein [Clostridia bacterium]
MNANINFYGDFSIEKTEPEVREISGERVNLLLGRKQKIKNYEKIESNFETEWFNTPADSPRLTDGNYAKELSCYDEAFFHFTSGCARTVMYDLGSVCAVDGASMGLLREAEMGVGVPPRVSVLISEDGENWQTVGEMNNFCTDLPKDMLRKTVDFGAKYKARYVQFFFYVSVHIWIDQFEVFGCTDLTGAIDVKPDELDENQFPNKYASTEELGAKDVLLAYICHKDVKPITKEIFLPHVAYMENDEIKDTLFDGYLFLPYVAFLYDKYKKRPLKKEDWQHYIDTQYIDGYNMDALEEAVAEVGEKLGIKDYKVSIYLSILYPVTEVSEFGVVDGKNLNFANLEDRQAGVKWLIDEQYRRFKEKNYKHLDLKGYYWFTEEISYSDKQLISLLRYTTDYVRSLGLITTWIPYYHASGYNDWRNLGFDMVCYQPNYAFNQAVPDIRLFNAAETAKLLGMCIELEVGGMQDWNIERIKKYYAAGAITGYMKDAAHMYYQGGVPDVYYYSYKSEDPKLHSVYTDTYRFIKGTYEPDEIEFNLEEN